MKPHSSSPEDIIKGFSSSAEAGLSEDQVAKQKGLFGENKLASKKPKTTFQRFLDQFRDVMILILLVAAGISFVVALHSRELAEFFEPVLILVIVILNAALGVLQENKAEKAMDALRNLSAPRARVVRNGSEAIIDAADLVPGDIILLEAGDYVPADARLIESSSLKSEESALTGESVPAEKNAKATVPENAPLGDRATLVFSGCSIVYGRARAVVVATGMQTEMGKIANLLNHETDNQTPLQAKLAQLGKYLAILAIAACAVIFLLGIWEGMPLLDIFMIGVALAVSAIPEGLPAIVTIVLSIGIQRMVKRNAIIRRLPAVETLGSASVICSDKTGTLTQNRMTLTKGYADGQNELEDITPNVSDKLQKLLQYGTLCSDASIVMEEGKMTHIGDPTETAILVAAYQNGMTKDALQSSFPRVAELPFDSERKRMSTIHQINGKHIAIVKGAFDRMAPICTSGDLTKAEEMNHVMGANALRVLAIGYKEVDPMPDFVTVEAIESDLTFLGLIGMIDPPRSEAREAVEICKHAGICPVMITGDHIETASAIARDLGILTAEKQAITGNQLADMKEETLAEQVEQIAVYARVSPEDKIRIVKAWQKKGAVVAMTGDGVNDAPALKAADIGCAMGITGTDVAKGAADMTLTDDNFVTIVEAVKEGRGVYDNIKKVVGFLLGTNIGEVLTVFFAMLLWRQTPLLSMQLLWINLVTDSIPAIALGMEPVEKDVMERKPKPKEEGIFAHGFGIRTVLQGFLFALLTLIGFWLGKERGGVPAGQTMAFLVLATTQIVQAFNMRSIRSLFQIGFFSNTKLNVAGLLSLALIALIAFTPLAIPFGLVTLSTSLYLWVLILALIPLPVMELAKVVGWIK